MTLCQGPTMPVFFVMLRICVSLIPRGVPTCLEGITPLKTLCLYHMFSAFAKLGLPSNFMPCVPFDILLEGLRLRVGNTHPILSSRTACPPLSREHLFLTKPPLLMLSVHTLPVPAGWTSLSPGPSEHCDWIKKSSPVSVPGANLFRNPLIRCTGTLASSSVIKLLFLLQESSVR